MNLEKLRAKLAYVTRPAPEHLAWIKIVCKCKIYFGNLMKLTVATYDVWQTCKYIVLLYLGNVYKKMKNKLAVEMFIWNSDRTNLKMQEIKPMAFGILSVTVDSYELVIGSKDKLTRWIVKIFHGPNKNSTWWPVQKKTTFFEVADPESLPNKSSKNENCEKNPLPIRKSKKLLERKEDKEAKKLSPQ